MQYDFSRNIGEAEQHLLSHLLNLGALALHKMVGETDPCGLFYKTITIIIMTIVSDATIWSVSYDRN